MSDIDTFAALLGVPAATSAPQLTDAQRVYVAGFVSGLRSAEGRRAGGVPMLPASAPFDAKARLWLDGLLAGLFSRAAQGAGGRGGAPRAKRRAPRTDRRARRRHRRTTTGKHQGCAAPAAPITTTYGWR